MMNLVKEHAHFFLPAPSVPLGELLSLRFLTKYTDVSSVKELVERSGLDIAPHRLAYLNDREWDAHIRTISHFRSWRALLAEAKREWYFKQRIFQRLAA